MLNLDKHPYFKEYVDEKTGVKSYFLTKKVAKLQQHNYFCNTSITYDNKYMWIRCINPPALIQTLAVVSLDAENPFIRHFPGAGFSGRGNLPLIIPGTHDVIFAEGPAVYKVNIEGEITKLMELDSSFIKHSELDVERMFTHASLSCDGKTLILDIRMSDKTYIALGNIETGEIKHITKFGRYYDHAMFSPVDPDLFIIDQDGWSDPDSGERFGIDNRIWLMNPKDGIFEPLLPNSWWGHGENGGDLICHDFWGKDGTVCYIDYREGAFECDVKTRQPIHVWKRSICHAHTNGDRSMWVGDESPYSWHVKPCRVIFYDRKTNKELDIFSAMPRPHVRNNSSYHLDPHPAFSDDGEYIISTVTLLDGNADVAITPVEPLVELCRTNGKIVTGEDVFSFASCRAENIVIDKIKLLDSGTEIMVRMHDISGKDTNPVLEIAFDAKNALLLAKNGETICELGGGTKISVPIASYEAATVKLIG